MRDQQDQIVQIIYSAIDLVNQQSGHDAVLDKLLSTPLYGSDSALDSLDLINLVITIEQGVKEAFGKTLVLADDRALAQEKSPFSTVESLRDYIALLLDETLPDKERFRKTADE